MENEAIVIATTVGMLVSLPIVETEATVVESLTTIPEVAGEGMLAIEPFTQTEVVEPPVVVEVEAKTLEDEVMMIIE